jgi:hypothetical protein
LNELGRKVTVQVRRTSKVAKSTETFTGGSLRDSGNYRVKPFNFLVLSENEYGKWNTPKGKATPSDRDNIKDNPMLNAIDEYLDDTVNVIINDITNLLVSPITQK